MPAKMSPTSPRGIIPRPTVRPETSRGTTSPHTHLPTTAASVSSTAKPGTSPWAKDVTSTSIPIRTKKTGTRRPSSGASAAWRWGSPRFTCSSKWTSSRTRPAAKAPTMGARPARAATHASPKHRLSERAWTRPLVRSRRDRCRPEGLPTRGGGDDPAHHRQHDKAQHVVDHRRPQDDAGRPRADEPGVLEHPGRDPDARRREHGAEEGVAQPGRLGMREPAQAEAEEHRRHHADDRHPRRGPAHREHLPRCRLEADPGEQKHRPQLAENSGLPDPLDELSGELGPDQDHHEHDEDALHVARGGGGEEGGYRGQPAVSDPLKRGGASLARLARRPAPAGPPPGLESARPSTKETPLAEPSPRIGVLRGRENSLPDAFIAKVNSMNRGVRAEVGQVGGTKLNEPV